MSSEDSLSDPDYNAGTPTTHTLYHQHLMNNIPAHSRHIYPTPQPDMLRQSPSQIKKWLHIAVPFIKADKAAMATMVKYTTHDIRNSFPSLRDQRAAPTPFIPTAGNLTQQS